jgi:hypothetical protein
VEGMHVDEFNNKIEITLIWMKVKLTKYVHNERYLALNVEANSGQNFH